MGFDLVVIDDEGEESTAYTFDVEPEYVKEVRVTSFSGTEVLPVKMGQTEIKLRLTLRAPTDLELITKKLGEHKASAEEEMYGQSSSGAETTPYTGEEQAATEVKSEEEVNA